MDAKTPTTTPPLEDSAIHLLHRAGQRAGDIFSEEMKSGDLTPRQYAVLQSVAQNEGLSQTDLVSLTGIDRSTLADIIRRMLKKGLIHRRRTKDDARAYAVRLTSSGWEALQSAQPAAVSADQRVLSQLPVDKRNEFIQALNSIVNGIDEAH